MNVSRRGFTLTEAAVVVCCTVLLGGLLAPGLRMASETDARKACSSNLRQIVMACWTYQEPNADFFPAHSQYVTGEKDDFKPMPSLALLFPEYIDDPSVFGCPSTDDKPFVSVRRNGVVRWNCFGTDIPGKPAENPAAYSGKELGTDLKCSYFYDARAHFREVGPGQALGCDADGQTWTMPDGTKPAYPENWTRTPRRPNHEDGQNVMYVGGHVKWVEGTPYGSDDPDDNMFCPDVGTGEHTRWNPDVDCYLWDGVNARPAQKHEE